MSGIDRIILAIAWALVCSTLAAIVEVAWFHIEPLGLFSNRDFFAEAAAPVFVWARCYEKSINCHWHDLGRWSRYLRVGRYHTLCIAILSPLIFCGSRLAVLGAMAGIAIARPRWWWQTLIALPILAEAGTKVMGFHGKLASLKERGEIWHQTTIHITPWGRGMGWFAGAFPHYEWAHSDALQAAAELGVGIIPFALIVAWLVWRAAELRGPLVASLVTALGGFALHEAGSGLVAAVLAGGVVGAWHRQRRSLSVGRVTMDDHRRRAATGD